MVWGTQVISGVITQGELVEFLLYLVMLSMPIRMLGWLTILFSRASASGKRIFEILDQSSPVNEKPDAKELKDVKGDVVFENVSFGYDSQGSTLKERQLRGKTRPDNSARRSKWQREIYYCQSYTQVL